MNLPKRYLALFLLLATVPLATWAVAYQPINQAVVETAEEIRTQTNRLSSFSDIKKQHMEMRAMITSIHEASEVAMDRLPKTHNADDWLELASASAMELGLTIKSVTVSGIREEGEFSILPIDISLRGSFDGVYKFIQTLEQLKQLGRIEQMTMSRLGVDIIESRFVIHLLFSPSGASTHE